MFFLAHDERAHTRTSASMLPTGHANREMTDSQSTYTLANDGELEIELERELVEKSEALQLRAAGAYKLEREWERGTGEHSGTAAGTQGQGGEAAREENNISLSQVHQLYFFDEMMTMSTLVFHSCLRLSKFDESNQIVFSY